MFGEIGLALWTGAGLAWWIVALTLVSSEHRRREPTTAELIRETASFRPRLTVFKPLPPLRDAAVESFLAGLESFAAQLDVDSEMLVGAHEVDRARVGPFLTQLRDKFPKARMEVVWRSSPDDVANPKIAWQQILAPHAAGELWLWSDGDIVAPPGFLATARARFGREGETMVTYPYVVRELPSPAALLEVLFVNLEFYPGVLLLRRFGAVDFGLGAAMLFRRADFMRRANWDDLGAALADDFVLGQMLGPVRVGEVTLTTVPASKSWRAALAHDLRWTKTIRWNRPGGSFARIFVMPLMGWLTWITLHPGSMIGWLGFVAMMQVDVAFAWAISLRAGCRLRARDLPGAEFWSLWRVILWFVCWLPMPVYWSGKVWHAAREEFKSSYHPGMPIATESLTSLRRNSIFSEERDLE